MPLDQDTAVSKAQALQDAAYATRSAYEAYCGVCLAYAYGDQWAYRRNSGGRMEARQLRTVIDPNRSDVRMSMNMIRSRLTKLDSRMKPMELTYRVKPRSRAINDQNAAMVAQARLEQILGDIDAIRVARAANMHRLVYGSCCITRSLDQTAQITLRDAAGEPLADEQGNPRTVRTFRPSWHVAPPYQFIRDPAADDPTFRNEECIGHEAAWTVEKIRRVFGVQVETEATLGKLHELQGFLRRATGEEFGGGFEASRQKAVLVSAFYFRDDENDTDNRWPWMLMAYRDYHATTDGRSQLVPLWFGPNPFWQLPIHHFWFEQQPHTPWGKGVPAITMQAQDATNIAFVMMMRQLVQHGNVKWAVEHNSLVDEIGTALSNRMDKPVVYKRGASAPSRIQPPALDQTTQSIMQATPTWFDWLLNMSPVQGGHAVSRGEAAKAYEVRRDMADTTINAVIDDDELTYNELLTGTLFDVVKHEPAHVTFAALSGEFTEDAVVSLKQQDAPEALSGVQIVKDSLRPKTPEELRAEAQQAVQSQMLDPIQARRALLHKGGAALDPREQAARDRQLQEIQRILAGEHVTVEFGQDHGMHKWVLEMQQESARWDGYTDEQREALMQHWARHVQAEQMKAQMAAGIMPMQQQGASPQPSQAPQLPQAQQPAQAGPPAARGQFAGNVAPAMTA